jgi:outer membrane protein TolC
VLRDASDEGALMRTMFPAIVALSLLATSVLGDEVITVRPGDTLYKIARERLGADARWRDIAARNNLQPPYQLRVGDSLVLPGPGSDSNPSSSQPPPTAASSPQPRPDAQIREDGAPPDTLAHRHGSGNVAASAPPDAAITLTPPPTPATPVVPLVNLMAELEARNPAVASARAAARAATYRPSQARSLPDPMLRATLNSSKDQVGMIDAGVVSFREESMFEQMIEVSQMIPVGKLAPMGRMEEAMALRQAENARMQLVHHLGDLKKSYAEIYLVDRSAAVLERTRNILKLLVSSTEAMFRVGEAKQADILRAQLEVSMIGDKLLMLEGRRRAAVEEINALLQRPAGSPLGRADDLRTYDFGTLPGLENAPVVRMAEAEAKAAVAKVDVAKSMFIPDVELMGGIGVESMRNPSLNGEPVWSVGVGLTLPIWAGTKQAPGLREAEANLESARRNVEGEMEHARTAWEAALAMGRTARAQSLLYENTIIPQARLAVESSLSSWRVGAVDFMTVVTNVTTLLGYEIGAIEATGNFYKSVAMAEEWSGAALAWKAGGE